MSDSDIGLAKDLVNSFQALALQYAERGDNYGIALILVYGFAMLARVIILATHELTSQMRLR